MKVDVTQEVLDLEGNPIIVGSRTCPECGQVVSDDGSPLTLRRVFTDALMAAYRDEKDLPGKDKIERYELAKRIHDDDVIELATKEAASLQTLTNKLYASPGVVAQAWASLEGEDTVV